MQVFPNLFSTNNVSFSPIKYRLLHTIFKFTPFINNKMLIIQAFYNAFQSQANIFFYTVYLHVTIVSAGL